MPIVAAQNRDPVLAPFKVHSHPIDRPTKRGDKQLRDLVDGKRAKLDSFGQPVPPECDDRARCWLTRAQCRKDEGPLRGR